MTSMVPAFVKGNPDHPIQTNLKASAVTYVPATQTFYHGALGDDYDVSGNRASAYTPIAIVNHDAVVEHRQAKLEGDHSHKLDMDEVVEPVDHETYRQWARYRTNGSQGGEVARQAAMNMTSLANITRVELSTFILNEMYKKVYLHHGVTMIPIPKLRFDYPVVQHMKRRGKDALVKKRQPANVEASEYRQVRFEADLYGRLQRVIDVPDEDEYVAKLSPMKLQLSQMSKVMSQDINLIILEDGYEQFKENSADYGSWTAFASTGTDTNTNNPLIAIGTEDERINLSHGTADTLAMNKVTYTKLTSNTYLRGFMQMWKQRAPGLFSLPQIGDYTIIVDNDIAPGEFFIFDKSALTVGDGPMVTEAYRDAQAGVSGQIVRKWLEPKLDSVLKDAFGTRITGVGAV